MWGIGMEDERGRWDVESFRAGEEQILEKIRGDCHGIYIESRGIPSKGLDNSS